jgi:hypothetical protein
MPARSTPDIGKSIKIAQDRVKHLKRFIDRQSKLMQGKNRVEAALAAGKVLELVHDFFRAMELYEEVAAQKNELEPRARAVLNKIKSTDQPLVAEAEQLVREFPDKTFPNLITEEPLNAHSVLAAALMAAGDRRAESVLHNAADGGDDYSAARLGLKVSDALPKFMKIPDLTDKFR